jgi:hypothetical protein
VSLGYLEETQGRTVVGPLLLFPGANRLGTHVECLCEDGLRQSEAGSQACDTGARVRRRRLVSSNEPSAEVVAASKVEQPGLQ